MIKFRYNHDKNSKLLHERGVSFEEIVQSIEDGNLLDIKLHHNHRKHAGQKILYVRMIDLSICCAVCRRR
ncbi:hypothetical protein KNCP2_06540 [Candidatus Rickettsia kedanie]|uniref:DUF4258 domain-containing protein n=1 Tax=Candidatus Rickettsia kedanie TaxID=3115352 RepID=A0ABP9TU05_9RICK